MMAAEEDVKNYDEKVASMRYAQQRLQCGIPIVV
jgi:hypothetical protein